VDDPRPATNDGLFRAALRAGLRGVRWRGVRAYRALGAANAVAIAPQNRRCSSEHVGSAGRGAPLRGADAGALTSSGVLEGAVVAIRITCRACGFLYGFADDGIEYLSPTCPVCDAVDSRVGVEVDAAAGHGRSAHTVTDRLGHAVAGSFGSVATAGSDAAERSGRQATAPAADYLAMEFPRDERFWTADRVWALGLLDAQTAS
jgi:hypothetical protein